MQFKTISIQQYIDGRLKHKKVLKWSKNNATLIEIARAMNIHEYANWERSSFSCLYK